ncbi:MAG: hypothetical protein K8R92_02145 [Planctomycetes bacterium]|nr:hypothetical protein [Planctomycetota bacterium]
MLRFDVHHELNSSDERRLVGAHLLGRDDLPVAGDVKWKGGGVLCDPAEPVATALCLEVDAGAMGRLMLQTCLLKQRDEPYLLLLELARHRIKLYISKSEEWQLFDPEVAGESLKRWEKARSLFVQAMNEADPAAAETFAKDSLIVALDANERLALLHAELLVKRRFGQRASTSTVIGVRVDPRSDVEVCGSSAKVLDVLLVPTPWKLIEPAQGKFHFEEMDRWMAFASQTKRPIVAGPLLSFDERNLPSWMEAYRKDFSACVDRAYVFMEQVVHRYQGIVTMWNLGSGLHANQHFNFNDEQMMDLTRRASVVVRHSRHGSRTLIELTEPFCDHVSRRPGAITPWQYLERLSQEGIHFDAVGIQMCFGGAADGAPIRDLMQVSATLDRFLTFDCKVMVSAFGVPSRPTDPKAGWWRNPWSEQVQSVWASRFVTIALSKPFIETVVWERLIDHKNDATGLLSENGKPKSVFAKLLAIRKRLRKPLAKQPSTDETADETRSGETAVE